MISIEEALDRILSRITLLGSEKVSILDALGRGAAEDVYTSRDIPPFDHSGMDGYALRWEDVQRASSDHPIRLEVIEDLPAGSISVRTVRCREAIRIMTGARLPKGADTVVPVEETKQEDRFVWIFTPLSPGENIRKAGEDVEKGQCIASRGDLIRPAEVGMLASAGRSFVSVYQRPLVAILCTGEELVDVDGEPEGGKIVSSNSYSLAAQVRDCGALSLQLGIARDRKEEIKGKLFQGIRADVLIASAGVSAGDYDFVREALNELGMETIFWKVAIKPGKPVVFGTIRGKPVFGLPGNPVSSMVAFEQLVRPALLKMMGHRQLFRPVIEAILKDDIRKKPGRRHFVRASISFEGNRYVATVTNARGSGLLKSMVRANGLIVIPEDCERVRAGEIVKVQLLDIVRSSE